MIAHIRKPRIFFIIFILLVPLMFRPRIYGFDPVGYFSWVRSAVIDGNLDTTDEYHTFGNEDIAGQTITGYNHNPYAIGASLLWTPFFLVAHFFESGRAAMVQSPTPTGYESVYIILVSLGSLLYGFAAVLILYQLTRGYFDEFSARIAALCGWLATPLVFYMYSHPTMAHAVDAFANTLVVVAWIALRHSTIKQWFLLGAATGLAMLVRTQNALLIVIPTLVLLRRFWQTLRARPTDTSSSQKKGHAPLGGILISMTAYALGGLAGFWPQMLTWRIIYGHWIELNPYAHSDAGHFTWGQLWIDGVLFSTNRGLFIWSPIVILAVLGLILLFRRDRRLTVFLVWSLASQVTLVSMWSSPFGASAFGARLLLNNMPTYIFGLAAFIDWLKHHIPSTRAHTTGATAFILWNFLLIAQYVTGTIPRAGEFPIGDMIVGQFTVLPTQFSRLIQALLTRQ